MLVSQGVLAASDPPKKYIERTQEGLWAEGYYSKDWIDSAELGRLDHQTREAIRRYQSDWEMPPTGEITDELIHHLERTHPATRAQWHTLDNKACQVWNPFPAPRESASWTGTCVAGKASGSGKLVWRSVRQGKPEESTYVGQLRGGMAHGRGVFTWPNGDKYEGDWQDDKPHGRGVETLTDGERYEGEWQDGKRHGQGFATWPTGDRYSGEWRDDELHGQGEFTWANGNHYKGQWLGGAAHGRGILTRPNGDRYEGEFDTGTQHGRGVFEWANGDRYQGDWKRSFPHGRGEYYNKKTGELISGDWNLGCLYVGISRFCMKQYAIGQRI